MKADVDAILAQVEPRGNNTEIEQWLEQQDAEQVELFWAVMKKGYIEEGRPFTRVYRACLEHWDSIPDPSQLQWTKRVVDAHFDRR